jgi:hypothetical protein
MALIKVERRLSQDGETFEPITADDIEKGMYLKIDIVNTVNNEAHVRIFQNKAHRLSGDTEFLRAKNEVYNLPALADYISILADSNESIKNNLISAGYVLLKLRLTDWIDN